LFAPMCLYYQAV